MWIFANVSNLMDSSEPRTFNILQSDDDQKIKILLYQEIYGGVSKCRHVNNVYPVALRGTLLKRRIIFQSFSFSLRLSPGPLREILLFVLGRRAAVTIRRTHFSHLLSVSVHLVVCSTLISFKLIAPI